MIYRHGKNEIELFDNIQDLPILRYQKFNKYIMMDNEVGSTFEDYDNRMVSALTFLKKEMIPEAIQELSNQRSTVFNSYNDYTPKGKAFACLIKRINNKKFKGVSSSETDKILKELDLIGLSYIDCVEKLVQLKKKSSLNLNRILRKTLRIFQFRK